MKKFLRAIFSQKFLIVVMLLAQLAFLAFTVLRLSDSYYWIYVGTTVLDVFMIVYIINSGENPSYKIAWLAAIAILPVFGGLVYLFVRLKIGKRFYIKLEELSSQYSQKYLMQNKTVMEELAKSDIRTANLAKYLEKNGFPIYKNTEATYFRLGEEQFEAMLGELERAERFIFMEYFIISDGYMFGKISEVLIRKARSGVDVRLMYDGIGTNMAMRMRRFKHLAANGVQCKIFNKFTPSLSIFQNNRDHRKIVVIDGHTAFTGGTNIADEYINRKVRFGHWKDTAIMLKGEAVRSFTVMFLQIWDMTDKQKTEDYSSILLPDIPTPPKMEQSYMIPYSDTPLKGETIGKMVYIDIVNNAENYVYITTPYLVLDNELLTALEFAAEKGVDVRILTPHIPDKKYMRLIALRYYPRLIQHGVKIYEYTPGFIHAKSFVSDDTVAVVGTINLDYRSLYLHYECACLMYRSPAVEEIRDDFLDAQSISTLITTEYCNTRPIHERAVGWLLNLIAPLL